MEKKIKLSEIEVGQTYQNAGAGQTTRTVTLIYFDCGEVMVKFYQRSYGRKLFDTCPLKAFARWAGKEV